METRTLILAAVIVAVAAVTLFLTMPGPVPKESPGVNGQNVTPGTNGQTPPENHTEPPGLIEPKPPRDVLIYEEAVREHNLTKCDDIATPEFREACKSVLQGMSAQR